MFRLIRFVISCLVLSAVVWFAVTVPLGKRTLFGHLLRIAKTEEARDLAQGAGSSAKEVAKRVREEIHNAEVDPKNKPASQK